MANLSPNVSIIILNVSDLRHGFPGGKEPACQCRRLERCRFDPWARKIPWRRSGSPLSILAWRIPWTEEPGQL